MKKLICFVLSCSLLSAQITLVAHNGVGQGTSANGYAASTGNLNAAAANRGLACVIAYGGDPSTASVVGTSGTWTFISGTGFNSPSSSTTNISIWSRAGSFSSTENLTATLSAKFPAINVAYFSNLGAIDQVNGGSYTGGGTYQAGSVTPTVNQELAFGCFGLLATSGTGPAITSGATLLDANSPSTPANEQGLGSAYTIQTSAAAFNPTWNVSGLSGASAGSGVNASFFLFTTPATSNMPPIVMAARRADPWLILVDTVKRRRALP